MSKPQKQTQESETTTKQSNRSLNIERKKVSKPTGQLQSTNIGIKSILNPKTVVNTEQESIDLKNAPYEKVSGDAFDHAWKEYSLKAKREKNNSLFSTLSDANPQLGSDLIINITIKNSIALKEYDNQKPELVKFLRAKLRNHSIDIKHTVLENAKMEYNDSKSKFIKLLNENQSLEKFRKLFNLDIDS